jgi:hypothetical protein
MSARIYKINRIIPDIKVAIPTLRLGRIGYNSVRTDKAVKIRVVESRIIVVQPGGGVKHLARKEPVGQGQGDGVGDDLAAGIVDGVADPSVALRAGFCPGGIYHQAGRAEVVAEGVTNETRALK